MITREDMITQSAQDHLRVKLTDRGYPVGSDVVLLDSFPYNTFSGPLDKNYVAAGFDFDDGGEQAELGSDLIRRQYTIEVFVFGKNPVWGRNLANVIRSIFDDGLIPLKDITADGAPVIDQLCVFRVSADRQPIADPKPWEENVWLVTVKVDDEYFAGLT